MALRLLTSNIIRPYAPAIRTAAIRGYATKYYTKEHEWISVEKDEGTLGITDHAQQLLGDVVFVEIHPVGEETEPGSQIGAVESVKAASDIYSPVSGEIIQVNELLAEEPSQINDSPEENGWIAKIKLSNPKELEDLLDKEAYLEFVAQEESSH
ncbi:unnamed protein product [Cunninghamella blakesleeana]